MSFNARVTYTANGSTNTFSFSFPYILQSHVKAFVNGTEDTNITFPTASSVQLSSTPANGAVVLIQRTTPSNARLVDFQDGSVLTSADLDQSADQNFFLAQETSDNVASKMGLNANDLFDADNKRIINVATPTGTNDAANKAYVDNVAGSATAASASATAAENAKNAAEAALDTFDDRFLGSKSSNPSVDNDGNALVDGALYFDTTNNVMKVYDIGNTQWKQLTPTTSQQTNIDTVANANSNITAIAGQISPTNNISTLAGQTSEISTLAGITNLTNLANAHTAITNVSNNLSGVNSFAERYRVQAGVPSSSNDVGDLVFDTTANKLKVFDGTSYALAGSSVNGTSQRFRYVATAGQTTFSGADANGNTLTYDVASGTAFADIYLNGVKLDTTDFTATNGTSIVLGSGASVNDIFQVVSYGTFSLSAQNANDITTGTLNNDRLPSPVLEVKGDGSSADGELRLRCSQNSHYAAIKSPAHANYSGNLTFTLPTNTGTNGQVLATNGSGVLSFIDATETKPTVANVSQTIAPATATTINITGTNFVSIPQVDFIKTDGSVTRANTVSFTNATTLSVNVTLASGNYHVRVENPDGNAGRSTNNIITASTAPSFTTAAGSLGTFAGNFSGTLFTIQGSSDSAITFSEVTSNLSGANVTLTSAGALTTTDFGGSSTTATQYNFTVRITDAEGQTADRAFSISSSFGATGGAQHN